MTIAAKRPRQFLTNNEEKMVVAKELAARSKIDDDWSKKDLANFSVLTNDEGKDGGSKITRRL